MGAVVSLVKPGITRPAVLLPRDRGTQYRVSPITTLEEMTMNRLCRLFLFVCIGASIAGCDGSFGPLGELPRDLSVAEGQLIDADNRFAFKLFREINRLEGDTNIFISPLSVALALGMTLNGADGTTEQAMMETLELQVLSREAMNESYRTLIDLLRNLDPNVEFQLANSIWHAQHRVPAQEFLDINQQYFDAEVAALNFGDPAAVNTINDWVYSNTNGKIEKIIDDGIPVNVIMYLINAVYFKGDWTYQFDKDRTRDADFYLADGSTTTVQMMSQEAEIELRSTWRDRILVAELPYSGDAYCMTILLPDEPEDIGSVVDELTEGNWNGWIDGLYESEMAVSLPKFTLEYELALNDALKALGMEVAFDPAEADFTRMYPSGGVWIDTVLHKTFVDVNEEGTEAAAITSVSMRELSAPSMLLVNRPFVFVIRERLSGTILFMGKVVNPNG